MQRFCALKSGSSVPSMFGCSCFQPYGTEHESHLTWHNIHVDSCRKLPHEKGSPKIRALMKADLLVMPERSNIFRKRTSSSLLNT